MAGLVENEVLGMFTGIITVLFCAMIGTGGTLAFDVPLIPFVAWMSGAIKWVVSVAETLIAAPIWAAAHLHPDGDDAVGRAGPGYMIILSAVLRPVPMVFGLIASIAAAQSIAHLVNGGFMLAIKGSMHDGANGIGAFIAYCVIYVIIMTTVLHSVFALLNFIPDSALRFMGNAVGMHGIADSEGHESQRVFMAAATHGNRAMAGSGSEPRGDRPASPARWHHQPGRPCSAAADVGQKNSWGAAQQGIHAVVDEPSIDVAATTNHHGRRVSGPPSYRVEQTNG